MVFVTASGTANKMVSTTYVHIKTMKGDLEGIQMLFKLKDPPDVNAIDQNSNTALHHACFHGQTDIITYLLNTHTNIHVEAKNIDGNTPLHKIGYPMEVYVFREGTRYDIRKLLFTLKACSELDHI